ncbi:unnamed protein product [Brachionus calyciflorus]|uniref:Endonuclease/exonuclease/phosphatase domain-containing protein n=1 Tax=Brachionus calyciflorus TaxID=104777 RepID=A0A814PAD9_9BILA|nr:unnamed protein product [Brachionus calyciflorus]
MYSLATYNCHNFKSNFNKTFKNKRYNFYNRALASCEFNLKDKGRGRPCGGKMWPVKKGIKTLACYELKSNIMAISVELGNGKSLQIYGVWLKSDDNSSESLEYFQSNLLMLESEIKNNIEKKQPFIIMGDWNADIKDYLDSKNVGYTYRNGGYKALIDHIVWFKNESDFKMVDVMICNNNDNSSDDLPITIIVNVDLGVKDEFKQI